MEESLIKILSETDELTHEASEMAYEILIQIPSSHDPSLVIENLVAQRPNMTDLSGQSICYRMFLTKNINMLSS